MCDKLVDRFTFNVLGVNGSFRQSAFTELFNPTNTTPPFFQVFDDDFLRILGSTATIRSIASNPDFAFAHEAPIWLPDADDVYFASLDGSPLGHSDIDHNNQVSKISLNDVARAIDAAGPGVSPVNVSFTKVRAQPFKTPWHADERHRTSHTADRWSSRGGPDDQWRDRAPPREARVRQLRAGPSPTIARAGRPGGP